MSLPPINELFSTPEEQHAFILGYFELLAPWPPHHRLPPPDYLKDEQHYYNAGRGIAVLTWIGIAKLVHYLFW